MGEKKERSPTAGEPAHLKAIRGDLSLDDLNDGPHSSNPVPSHSEH